MSENNHHVCSLENLKIMKEKPKQRISSNESYEIMYINICEGTPERNVAASQKYLLPRAVKYRKRNRRPS